MDRSRLKKPPATAPTPAPAAPSGPVITGLDPLTMQLIAEAPLVPDALIPAAVPAAPPSDTTHQNVPPTPQVDSGEKVSIFAVLGGFCAVGLLTALAIFSGRQPGKVGRPAANPAGPVPRNLTLTPAAVDPLAAWDLPGARHG